MQDQVKILEDMSITATYLSPKNEMQESTRKYIADQNSFYN